MFSSAVTSQPMTSHTVTSAVTVCTHAIAGNRGMPLICDQSNKTKKSVFALIQLVADQICTKLAQHKYLLRFSRSHFLYNAVYHNFRLVPEFRVHGQVNEEVGNVVDVREIRNPEANPRHVQGEDRRHVTDDIDEHNKNQLLHGYHVTLVGL